MSNNSDDSTISKFEDYHIDALQELGNIGSGHAATALAEILNRRIDMSLPRFQLLKTPDLSAVNWRGDNPADLYSVVIVETKGEAVVKIVTILDKNSTICKYKILHCSPNLTGFI